MQTPIGQIEQKKLLIQSTKKLVAHLSCNPQRQLEIFNALSLHDFNKILNNLKDQNEYLRRISALLLCQMFFMCTETKKKCIEMLGLQPKEGRICLGGIPDSISKYPSTLKKCLQFMKSPLEEYQQDKMCWVINLERKTLRLQTLQYKNYSTFTFIDPHKNIFGFTLPLKSNKNSILGASNARKEIKIDSMKHSIELNEDFYKTIKEAKTYSNQSKRHSFEGTYIDLGSIAHTPTTIKTDRFSGRPNTAYQFGIKKQDGRQSFESGRNTPALSNSIGGKYISGIDQIINPVKTNTVKEKVADKLLSTYRKGEAEKISHSISRERDKNSNTMMPKDPIKFYQKVRDILHK